MNPLAVKRSDRADEFGPADTVLDPKSSGSTARTSHDSLPTDASYPVEPPPTEVHRRFLEELRAEATAARGSPVSLDWSAIRSSAVGAESPERATGRVVIEAARVIFGDLSTISFPPPTRPGGGLHGVSPQVPLLPGTPGAGSPSASSQFASAVALPLPVPGPVGVPGESSAITRWLSRAGTRREVTRTRLWIAAGWVRNIGILLVLFVGWQLWGTSITEHHAQSALRSEFEAKSRALASRGAPAAHGGPVLIPASTRLPEPGEGTPVALIQIPAIGVNQAVVEGTAESDLAKGPGHYVGTSLPGQGGNVAIAGHRTTYGAPFNRLDQLVPGDKIFLTTLSGEKLTYAVSGVPTPVSPSDISVLDDFGDNRLTLTTCNPKFSAAQRLIATAEFVAPSGGSGASARAPGSSSALRNAGETADRRIPQVSVGWQWGDLPLVLLLGLPLVLLGLGYGRLTSYLGRLGSWIVLVPVWVAGLYLLFQAMPRLLPPTL